MRHLTTLFDLSSDEVREILTLAAELKSQTQHGQREAVAAGQVLVQVFEKPSLRTRVSFEAAMGQLGGSCVFLPGKEAGFGGRETIEDIARVIGSYADVISLRTFSQTLVETFARESGCPVINALSDDYHPCQALTDIMTLEEVDGSAQGKQLVYVGDGNNVARSLAIACGHVGADFTIAAPKGYELASGFVTRLQQQFPKLTLKQLNDTARAVTGADIIYTDVWASMGQEQEKDKRSKEFAAFQISEDLLDAAGPNVRFMHCLPARRGLEVTDGVMQDPRSIVFLQAENRMHLAKGLIVWLLRHAKSS